MAVARSMRRTSPISLLLAALLAFGFICFMLSPTAPSASTSASAASSQQRQENAAEHPLSPPTKPFFKSPAIRSDGHKAAPPVVHYNLNSLTSTANSVANGERVLILTPLARFYQGYWDNLEKLSYPHELISLGFIAPKTTEGNAAVAALEKAIAKTQSGPIDSRFASISILRQDFEPPLTSQNEKERHKLGAQKERRESMSRARNTSRFYNTRSGHFLGSLARRRYRRDTCLSHPGSDELRSTRHRAELFPEVLRLLEAEVGYTAVRL